MESLYNGESVAVFSLVSLTEAEGRSHETRQALSDSEFIMKKILQAQRSAKPEPSSESKEPTKRSSEEAANATAQAKKLIKLGAIKLDRERKESQSFKRTKRQKDAEKASVSFQPFSPAHGSGPEEEKYEPPRRAGKSLYDSFVKGSGGHDERPRERRFRGRDSDRGAGDGDKERDVPTKGHTVYVHGHGITEEIMRKAFGSLGTIVNISMERERNCGFVSFDKMETSDEAIAQVNGSVVEGVTMKVSMARRQPNFDQQLDTKTPPTWSTIAANDSQKGFHKDKRNLVAYDEGDMFS